MFEGAIAILDWLGIVAFAITGALVASRNQMDVVGFMLLGAVTGIGGGTIRELLLGRPAPWIEHPEQLAACILVSVVVFFTAHLAASRLRLILWVDAMGLALVATVGAERALSLGAAPLTAVVLGVVTATFGGIVRDVLGGERSIIFSREIYVTAAATSAGAFVALDAAGLPREAAMSVALLAGFGLRAGALARGWSLPRHRPRPPRG
jgi:uncharacterized membrane protein YeiH